MDVIKGSFQNIKQWVMKYQKVIKIVFTILVLVFLVQVSRPKEIYHFILNLDLQLLLWVVALKFITDIFKIVKWQILVRTLDPSIPYFQAARSFYIGVALAVITPFAIGELGRGAFIANDNKAGLSALVILDKVLDLWTVVFFSGLGVSLAFGWLPGIISSFIFYILGLLAMMMFPRMPFIRRFEKYSLLKNLVDAVKTISAKTMAIIGILSLIYFVLFYYQAYLIMVASRLDFSFEAVFYFPLITLSTVLPVTIGGVGIREATAILLLKQYEIPEALAFNTFFIHFLIANVFAGLIGMVMFWNPARSSEEAT